MVRRIVYLILPLIVLGACASGEKHVDNLAYISSGEQNPGAQIAELDAAVEKARAESVDLLSPNWFRSAVMSLNDAKNLRDSDGSMEKLFREVAEGKAQLARAYQFAAVARTTMPAVIKARDRAIIARNEAKLAGAANLQDLQDEFESVEDHFRKLAVAVEENDMGRINDDRHEIITRYAKLEAQAMKKGETDLARRIVEQAEQEGAGKYAPRSLATAKQTIQAVDAFISNSPRNTKEVSTKADEAEFYANRALTLTRQSKMFDEKSPEDRVLWIENSFSTVANEIGAPDARDRGLEEQLSSLKQSAQSARTAKGTRPNPKDDRI